MTMTPDEVVKVLEETKNRTNDDNLFDAIQSALLLLQDYQKLRERVSVEVLRGIIRMNPTYYGISEKEFTKSIDKLADKIVTYLEGGKE